MAKKTNSKNSSVDRRQTFAFTAPDALSVLLAGDFTQWQAKAISMKKDAEGVWKTTVALPPGTHHYRFIVDGEWRDDPECMLRVANPYGTQDTVRQIA
jgi:1,4-alpha-glucan branching enzyme